MNKRVSQVSKEFIKDGKAIENSKFIELLEKHGVEGKKTASNITDDDLNKIIADLHAMGFERTTNGESVEKITEEKNNEQKSVMEASENKASAKSDVTNEVSQNEQKKDSVKEKALKNNVTANNLTKKKKSIIIIGSDNRNSSNNRNQRDNHSGSNAHGQYKNNNNDNKYNNTQPRSFIKPRDNATDFAAKATNRRIQAELEEQRKIDEANALKAKAEAEHKQLAENKEVKNAEVNKENRRPNIYDNRQQGFNRNSDNRQYNNEGRQYNNDNRQYNNDNRQFNNRRGDNNNFNNRDNRNSDNKSGFNRNGMRPNNNSQNRNSQDNRFSKSGQGQNGFNKGQQKPVSKSSSFTAEAVVPENDRHKDKSSGKARDGRSKKDQLYEEDNEIMLGKGRNSQAGKFQKPVKTKTEESQEEIKVITLPESIIIKDLADKMKIQPSAIVKKLFMQGKMVTVNQEISFEEAEEIALEYEIMCEQEEKVDVIAELLKEEDEAEENLISRPPVICVMGHVDHGKTSLLDAIRKTNVTEREAGGITQAIGAYTVKVQDRKITFLDTPGHEAFTSMRMRGANSTDIAILVVAADDGVMPQTVEAINHAKAAGIEIIVAVNKIDKPSANIDRVKQELSEYELIPEDWGGQTIYAPVSAKTGEGIENLLELVLLSADVLELKANPKRKARGIVIEAELDKGRGPVATVLVQKGTLHVGDFISAGCAHGKVRAMVDDKGRKVKDAGPSTPVEILGLDDVPNAGDIFICHDNDKQAKSYAETFKAQNKVKLLENTKGKMSLDDLYSKIQEGNLKELNIVIKADVQGSVEAVKQSLLKLSNDEVVVKVIHGGVGAINESDVILASASSAIIIGFNVRPDVQAKATAEHEGVDVRLYKVIYQAIEEMEAAMKGMLDAKFEEKITGHAEVQQIFKASAIGNIAGARVMDGIIQRDCKVRITREGELIFEGNLKSLKRFKDDVKEVKEGFECGLVFEEFDSMQEHDMVEAYIMVEVPRE